MGIGPGGFIGGIQLVLGVILTASGFGAPFGVPLIVAGTTTLAAALLAPRPVGGDGGFASSATYGFDGVSNAAFEGAPRFYVVGKTRLGPTYISVRTQQVGNKEYLKALLYCGSGGEHGIQSIEKIELNDQPLDHFTNAKITKRFGTSTQTAIKGFEKASTPWTQNHLFKTGNLTYIYRAHKSTDEIGMVFNWLGGMYRLRSDGSYETLGWGAYIYTSTDGVNYTKYSCPAAGQDGWTADGLGGWNYWAASTSVVRATINFTFTTAARYYIKVICPGHINSPPKWIREATVVRVEERSDASRAYTGSALIALEVEATSQLSGGLPKVTALIEGWKCTKLSGGGTAAFTRNPATILREIMLNENDGAGKWFSAAEIDSGSNTTWNDARDYFDANAASSGDHKEARNKLDLVVDSIQKADEWVNHIMFITRSGLIEHDGKVRWLVDKSGSSVRTFDARQNRAAGTERIGRHEGGTPLLAVHEIESDQRATHIRAQFFDATDGDYLRAWTDQIVDPAYVSGNPTVTRELYLPGVTRQTEAIRFARYSINRDRLRTQLVEFTAGPRNLDLLPMDVVTVSADYPAWTSKLFQVLAVVMTTQGQARIAALEYDADAYTDTTDKLPARDPFVARKDALKKAGKIARGANSVGVKVVPV